MAIKLVVFDMAGTTVDDNNNVHACLIKGFTSENLDISLEDANSVMGIPKPVAIRTLLENKFLVREHLGEKVGRIHAVFVKEMLSFYELDESVTPKKNAEEVFRQLRKSGIKVCLDTGFSREIADVILKRFGWTVPDVIDASITSDEVNNGRPFPDMIHKAMKDLLISSPSEVAKVGDTISDLQEGTSAECRFVIGITTGAYSAEELAKVNHTHLIDDLLDVMPIVTSE